jgi:hypothetical protein
MSLAPAREQAPAVESRRLPLVGNRLALAGTVLYLCEFLGLVLSHAQHLPHVPGSVPGGVAASYTGHVGGLGFLVGWFGIVQTGRVLFVVGVAAALSASGRRNPLVWFAAVAMAVGVALEIASEALAAGAGELAGSGQTTGAIALDRGAAYLAAGILAPSGAGILLTAWAMLRSGLFNRALAAIGLLAGASVVAAGLASEPANAGLQDSLTTGVIVSWVFMLWTGVALWRGRRR